MSKTSRAQRILPPQGGSVFQSVLQFFKNKKCYFLTINPHKKHKYYERFQAINKVSDRLRSRCSNHFIVREAYQNGGFHYHAVATGFDSYKPIIGLRVHCQVVGPSASRPQFDPNVESKRPEGCDVGGLLQQFPLWINFNPSKLINWIYLHSVNQKEKMKSYSTAQRARARNKVRKTHLGRVVSYMFKENPQVQYVDWMLCTRVGKIPPPPKLVRR